MVSCWRWMLLVGVVLMMGQVAEPTPQDLAVSLTSADGAVVSEALGQIKARLVEQPGMVGLVRSVWLKPLVENHREGEALSLCVAGICAAPWDLGNVEFLQRERVDLLVSMGKKEEGGRGGRGFFNVCSTGQTEAALLLLAERLNAVAGNRSGAVETLVDEERRGVLASDSAVVSLVVRGIRVDASPYDAAIKGLYLPSGELPVGGPQLVGLGNLLLLADRPGEALTVFEKYKSGAGTGGRCGGPMRGWLGPFGRRMRRLGGQMGSFRGLGNRVLRAFSVALGRKWGDLGRFGAVCARDARTGVEGRTQLWPDSQMTHRGLERRGRREGVYCPQITQIFWNYELVRESACASRRFDSVFCKYIYYYTCVRTGR